MQSRKPVAVIWAGIGLIGFIGASPAQEHDLIKPRLPVAPPPAAAEPITPSHPIELFNGKDFTGWTFFSPTHSSPAQTWTVTNGVIHCSGTPMGYMRTTQSFRDYRLMVEWRFVKVGPKADNTGVLVHMQLPDKLWPPCVQCQGKHDHQGDLFLMGGAESKEHRGKDANTALPMQGPSNEKPVGDWNTCEVVCQGGTVKAYVNGRLMNEVTECTVSSGYVGIQSEGGELEIRKVRFEPLR